MTAGRPTKFRVALREKFLFSSIEILNELLEDHRSGKKVLTTEQLLQLCQPMTLKDMATKLEVDNVNELSGEQKYELMSRYLNTLTLAKQPEQLTITE